MDGWKNLYVHRNSPSTLYVFAALIFVMLRLFAIFNFPSLVLTCDTYCEYAQSLGKKLNTFGPTCSKTVSFSEKQVQTSYRFVDWVCILMHWMTNCNEWNRVAYYVSHAPDSEADFQQSQNFSYLTVVTDILSTWPSEKTFIDNWGCVTSPWA